MENYYTAKEVADLLKIKKTTVYELVKKNQLPATKVGKQIRINKAYLDEYLKGHGGESRMKENAVEPEPVQVADAADSALTAREYLRNNTGLILMGEDDFLSVFCAYYQLNEKSIPVVKQTMNWYDALYSLYFGKIHAAFIPLPMGREREICDVMVPGLRINGIRVSEAAYGLFVRPEYASSIKKISDLASCGIRFIAGEKGSFERILFDSELKKQNIRKKDLQLVKKESISSLQGLMLMEQDQADAVIGCETSREQFPEFTFIPIMKCALYLLYNKKYESYQAFPAMEEVLGLNSFKRRLMLMQGYDCSSSGERISL